MEPRGLRSSSRVDEAGWIRERLRPFGSAVASVVPDGFSAYLRILHPAIGEWNAPVSWERVAALSGRTMHPLVQFQSIAPRDLCEKENIGPPFPGSLQSDLFAVLCEALRRHTSTPEACWFCLWEGYGWLHETAGSPASVAGLLRDAVRQAPRVHLPDRDYLLFEGPLEAARELGWSLTAEHFVPQSPNLFWPQDRAWCVATEIDFDSTLVAGSNELADALLADSRLEVWRVSPGDLLSAGSDLVNP